MECYQAVLCHTALLSKYFDNELNNLILVIFVDHVTRLVQANLEKTAKVVLKILNRLTLANGFL